MTESNEPDEEGGSPPTEGGDPPSFVDERTPQVRILTGLARVGDALRARAWEESAPLGLNPTQARILQLLSRADGAGKGLSALAEELGVSQPTASDSVTAMQKKGLVEKGPEPGDARRLSVTLSRKGRSAASVMAEWPSELISTVDRLSSDEQAAFLRSLVTVVRSLADSGLIAPARTCLTCRYFAPNVHDDSRRPHHCRFADAAFGDANLRLDCLDHEEGVSRG